MQTVEVTLTTKFTATVTGVGPFNYQWQRGNQILIKETRSTYVINHATQEDQNYYICHATNNYGYSVISSKVWLHVSSMYVPMYVPSYVLRYNI